MKEVIGCMKNVTMFILQSCPYCKQALRWMDELLVENASYKSVAVEVIDERDQPELADSFDYWYVPTYYVGDEKLHEGAATKQKIKRVYEAALEGY